MLIDVNAGFGGRESIQRFAVDTMLDQLERIPCGLAFVHSRQGASDATPTRVRLGRRTVRVATAQV